MAIQVIVFDFDGTLVDSNRLKHQVFYELFPETPAARSVVRDALKKHPEAHRAVTIRAVLEKLEPACLSTGECRRLAELVDRYAGIVLERVAAADEMPGATKVLKQLSARFALYLSSATPEEPLRELVRRRGWEGWFRNVYGHPRRKEDVLREILALHSLPPDRMLVVGDGRSDRTSAEAVGCRLFLTGRDGTLYDLLKHPMVEPDIT